jgi:hypothetical protein
MAVYVCLIFLALGLLTLVLGNTADPQRKASHFWVGATFVALAASAMIVSAIRSLWLYPLS